MTRCALHLGATFSFMSAGKDKTQGYLHGIIKYIFVREKALGSHCRK